jgi:hypothetical protein
MRTRRRRRPRTGKIYQGEQPHSREVLSETGTETETETGEDLGLVLA